MSSGRALFVATLLSAGVLVALLTVRQYDTWVARRNFYKSAQSAELVFKGTPQWEMFQSRVIAPYQTRAVQKLTDTRYEIAYHRVVGFWLGCFFILVAAAAWSAAHSRLLMVIALGVAATLAHVLTAASYWFHPWDVVDLAVFPAFVWAILKQRRWPWLAAVVVFETFNREVALVMALWMVLDAAKDVLWAKRSLRVPEPRPVLRFIGSALLFAASASGIYAMRKALLIRELLPERVGAAPNALYHFQFVHNLELLSRSLTDPRLGNVIALTALIAIPVACVLALLAKDRNLARAATFYLVLWAATFVVGQVGEARLFLSFIPLYALVLPLTVRAFWRRLRSSGEAAASKTNDAATAAT